MSSQSNIDSEEEWSPETEMETSVVNTKRGGLQETNPPQRMINASPTIDSNNETNGTSVAGPSSRNVSFGRV